MLVMGIISIWTHARQQKLVYICSSSRYVLAGEITSHRLVYGKWKVS